MCVMSKGAPEQTIHAARKQLFPGRRGSFAEKGQSWRSKRIIGGEDQEGKWGGYKEGLRMGRSVRKVYRRKDVEGIREREYKERAAGEINREGEYRRMKISREGGYKEVRMSRSTKRGSKKRGN